MNRSEVMDRMAQFLALLREEQELRDRATALRFIGVPEREAQEAMKKESEILRAIETLRKERLLPLLREVAEFVASKQKSLAGS